MKDTLPRFDEFLNRQNSRIKIMRHLWDYLQEDPDFIVDLRRAVAEEDHELPPAQINMPSNASRPTYAQQVLDYLRASGSKWQTAMQIAAGTALPAPSTRHLLYKILTEQIERKQDPNSARGVLWRLKQ